MESTLVNCAPDSTPGKVRSSNLELYRIVVMLLIVLHHYIANSGLVNILENETFSGKATVALLMGAWGKPGINCFVLITGYFMCTSQITMRKFAKLILEVYFYKAILYTIFVITGYITLTASVVMRVLVGPFTSVASNFTGCYVLFFLLIPFINKLIHSLSQKQHLTLILLLLAIYTVIGGLDGISVFSAKMNYVSWFTVLYLIAAYIRLYPNKLLDNTKLWGWATVISFLLGIASVVAGFFLGSKLSMPKLIYFFVSDCNKILALSFGVTSFLFFKNIRIPYSKFINTVGATTFGVLCIHANSPTMRQWLWGSFLKVTEVYSSALFPVYAIVSTLAIFAVCSVIDILRIRFVEAPFFRLWDRYYPSLSSKIHRACDALFAWLGVK